MKYDGYFFCHTFSILRTQSKTWKGNISLDGNDFGKKCWITQVGKDGFFEKFFQSFPDTHSMLGS